MSLVIFDYGFVVAGNVNDFVVTDESGKKIPGEDPSLEIVAKEFGMPYFSFKEKVAKDIPKLQRGEIEESHLWEFFVDKYASELPLGYNLPPDYDRLLGRDYGKFYPENGEVVSLIHKLKEHGVTVALLSNTVESHTRYNMEHGRYNKFNPVILSHVVGLRKGDKDEKGDPDLRIYELALERCGITTENPILVEDSQRHLDDASLLGKKSNIFIQPVLFRNGIDEVSDLKLKFNELGVLRIK